MSLESPEVHPPHKHGGRTFVWLEIVLSVSALIVSLSSIAIALHHGEIMEKLVQANSIPYLEGDASNVTPEGAKQLSWDFRNRGVGPAHEQSLRLRYRDQEVTSTRALLAAVAGAEASSFGEDDILTNNVRQRFIPAATNQMVFQIRRTAANGAAWDKVAASIPDWHADYCFCSVFHECWKVHDDVHEETKACIRDEAKEFRP